MKLSKLSTTPPESLSKKEIAKDMEKVTRQIAELQYKMWAEGKHSLLLVLQGIDGSGKDGVVKAVFGECTPQGVNTVHYKKPTDDEMAHDFLWRIHKHAPAKGEVTIFVRSHYEDVLIQRVHGWIDEERVKARFEAINAFEKLISVDNNTTIVKCFLHISKEKQEEKLTERMHDETLYWKHKDGDWEERKHWDQYEEAYEDVLKKCNTPEWNIVPSDKRWYRNYMVAKQVLNALESMDLQYPALVTKMEIPPMPEKDEENENGGKKKKESKLKLAKKDETIHKPFVITKKEKEEEVKPAAGKRGRPAKAVASAAAEGASETTETKPAGKRGRPSKGGAKPAAKAAAGKRGRPAKAGAKPVAKAAAGKRGRPAKTVAAPVAGAEVKVDATTETAVKPAAGKRGRPAKAGAKPVAKAAAGKRGRPAKTVAAPVAGAETKADATTETAAKPAAGKRGRPAKGGAKPAAKAAAGKRGRPSKTVAAPVAGAEVKSDATAETVAKPATGKRGRPSKGGAKPAAKAAAGKRGRPAKTVAVAGAEVKADATAETAAKPAAGKRGRPAKAGAKPVAKAAAGKRGRPAKTVAVAGAEVKADATAAKPAAGKRGRPAKAGAKPAAKTAKGKSDSPAKALPKMVVAPEISETINKVWSESVATKKEVQSKKAKPAAKAKAAKVSSPAKGTTKPVAKKPETRGRKPKATPPTES